MGLEGIGAKRTVSKVFESLRLRSNAEVLMRIVLSLPLLIAIIAAANAAGVTIDQGNIVFNGQTLTHDGVDSDPVLSPDQKSIVFNRRSAPSPSMKLCDTDAQELWTISIDGSSPRKLLSTHGEDDSHLAICAFDAKQFSSDGKLLYFETPAWVTSGATHVFDFRIGKERFVVASNGLKVLNDCKSKKYRDHLLVNQHRYYKSGGSYDAEFLYTPQGKEIRMIDDPRSVRECF